MDYWVVKNQASKKDISFSTWNWHKIGAADAITNENATKQQKKLIDKEINNKRGPV